MFIMLLSREWTIFKRNPMKGVRVIANSLFSVVLVGTIFVSGISDNRPSPSLFEWRTLQELNYYFIRAQGVYFVTMVSCIMSGIFSVSLACNYCQLCSSQWSRDLLQGDQFKEVFADSLLDIEDNDRGGGGNCRYCGVCDWYVFLYWVNDILCATS